MREQRNVFWDVVDETDCPMPVAPCRSVPITEEVRREDELRRRDREVRITWKPPFELPKKEEKKQGFHASLLIRKRKTKQHRAYADRPKRCAPCGHTTTNCQCATVARKCGGCEKYLGYRNQSGYCKRCSGNGKKKSPSRIEPEGAKFREGDNQT